MGFFFFSFTELYYNTLRASNEMSDFFFNNFILIFFLWVYDLQHTMSFVFTAFVVMYGLAI